MPLIAYTAKGGGLAVMTSVPEPELSLLANAVVAMCDNKSLRGLELSFDLPVWTVPEELVQDYNQSTPESVTGVALFDEIPNEAVVVEDPFWLVECGDGSDEIYLSIRIGETEWRALPVMLFLEQLDHPIHLYSRLDCNLRWPHRYVLIPPTLAAQTPEAAYAKLLELVKDPTTCEVIDRYNTREPFKLPPAKPVEEVENDASEQPS